MAGRLPRHRTMPYVPRDCDQVHVLIPRFFRHLTHSLGPSDFLAPVCMLLVDRTVTKAGRSAGLTLDLPLGVVGSYDVAIRMEVVLEVVQELARLVADTSSSQKTAFLSSL
jgi:U3 small nucleolar RNA-associated protein 10